MEAIITAILFSVPGIIKRKIYNRFFPSSIKEESEYTKTTLAIIDSIIILMINTFVLFILNKDVTTLNDLLEKLTYIQFMWKYLLLTFASCCILCFVNKLFESIITFKFFSIFNKITNRLQESKYPSEWENIFENNKVSKQDMYISIEKDGVLITQGLLNGFAPPNQDKRDITLIQTNEFKKYLENDKELPEDKKILDIVEKEYYDFSTGILIKIYDNRKIKAYLSE